MVVLTSSGVICLNACTPARHGYFRQHTHRFRSLGRPRAVACTVYRTLAGYCTGSLIRLLSALGAAALLLSLAACRAGAPVIDPSSRPTQVDGTISGTVRGPEGTSAIDGREVAVVNIETGERQRMTTNSAGGFTFKVKPGKYRVVLTLLEGESFIKRPGVMDINKSDVDAHADFIIGSGRIERPRLAAPRGGEGLGSPSA